MAKRSKTSTIYQLKITLNDITPPIWRQIQTPECSLTKLHEIIQTAMGWMFSHLWSFTVHGVEYSETEYGPGLEDSSSMRLSRLADEGVAAFEYTYDFGDCWKHTIHIEQTLAPEAGVKYPRCVAGERACPPEDCGGPWFYDEFLRKIRDPQHPEHQELLEWLGGEFDSEELDLDLINRRLRSSA